MVCGGAGEMDGGDVVVSTEDAVAALLNHFVEPLLPRRDAYHDPSPLPVLQQETVAKQVHAAVIIYNYYHRKRFQQLRFLDFVPFCKVATIAKPNLLRYLENFAKGDGRHESAHQLSITEKAVENACNICAALDASKASVNMEGWSVSKVAVFLVNTTRTKCLLKFSSVTKGAWSLVENVIDKSVRSINWSKPANPLWFKNDHVPTLREKTYANEDIIQDLVFSMVEKETGIGRENLCILGRHLTYSLTEENGVTFVYVMTYSQKKDNSYSEVPVADVISSLKGSIIKNLEYYPLLPYVENIMDYLIKDMCPAASFTFLGNKDNVEDKSDLKQVGAANVIKTSSEQVSNNIIGLASTIACSDPLNGCRKVADTSSLECNKPSKEHGQSMVDKASIKSENMVHECKKDASETLSFKSNPSKTFQAPEKKTCAVPCKQPCQTLSKVDCLEEGNLVSSKVDVTNRKRLFHQVDMEVDVKDSPVMKISQGQDGFSVIPVQNNISEHKEDQQAQQAQHLSVSKISDFLFPVLQAVKRRRNDLCNQQRALDDELAQCEMNIQKILSVGRGEMRFSPEPLLKACNIMSSSQTQPVRTIISLEEQRLHQPFGRKSLAEAFKNLRSSCQELDDLCCESNWMLPRYAVLSTNDGTYQFQANVFVRGTDFECTISGDRRSSPSESRESAAGLILTELRHRAAAASQAAPQ